MPQIHLLDESIAQKIAAGEVVEKPASVVKELLENSLDAGSTFVTVEIKEGGVQHIRVTDNGAGIAAPEVELAFLRHATSKIQTLDDLYNITQMGFRGEALYSIAAVSRLELTTKPAAQPAGVRLTIHGGSKVSMSEFGCPDGTSIIATDLFYNTPARLKFLNKPAIEASYVSSIVTRHILARPDVSIKFINNGKVFYHSAGDGSLKNAVYSIFGREVAQGLLPVEQSAGGISVSGYLFSAADAHGNRGRQMLIVNGRPVNNAAISAIVERIFAGMTDSRKFPGFVLHLTVPPADVDVNVHPNKLQVRFVNEYSIKNLIEIAVSQAVERIKSQPLIWSFPVGSSSEAPQELEQSAGEVINATPSANQADSIGGDPMHAIAPKNTQRTATVAPLFDGPKPTETMAESVDRLKESLRTAIGGTMLPGTRLSQEQLTLMQRPSIPNVAAQPQQVAAEASEAAAARLPEALPPVVRVIGQVFDTYALMEFEDKLLIVDQHAAHERLLYERFVDRLRSTEPCSQKLLIPQVVNLTHEQKASLDENLAVLENMGFELEEYGKLSYQVRSVPFILGQPQVQDFLYELLDILSEDRTLRTEELKQERLMSMACKKAVKGGDRLSASELSALAAIIASEEMPLTCPHGRPFVIVLDRKSMEKQFKRVK